MKILFYNHTAQVSGAERLLLMILSRLDREEFQVVVVGPGCGPFRQLVEKLECPYETVPQLRARFTWRPHLLITYLSSFFTTIRSLRKHIRREKPDLVHANSIRAGLAASLAGLGSGTQVVWHLHDLLPKHIISSFIRTFAFLSPNTRMIAVSRAVADNFCGHFSRLERSVSVILNGVDLERFRPTEYERSGARAELNAMDDDLIIGIVGQLTPRKGQLELVRAFAKALKELPHAHLVVVGAPLFNRDQEYADLLSRTSDELGITSRVRMLGNRTDVNRLMQGFDLLVVNSKAEPFGLVIPEAMASGTPVLATRVDGIPEIIQHRRNGWLIPAGNEGVLTRAIVEVGRSNEIRFKLASQAQNHVAEWFGADRYLSEVHSFYRRAGQLQAIRREGAATIHKPRFTQTA